MYKKRKHESKINLNGINTKKYIEERKKAQDVFNETNFLFASKTNSQNVLPKIKNIDIKVTETGK